VCHRCVLGTLRQNISGQVPETLFEYFSLGPVVGGTLYAHDVDLNSRYTVTANCRAGMVMNDTWTRIAQHIVQLAGVT
jgi:hypothetical protein